MEIVKGGFDEAGGVILTSRIDFADIPKSLRPHLKQYIDSEFSVCQNEILSDTPVDTGRLLNGERFSIKFGASYCEVKISDRVNYASYQEFGTQKFDGRFFISNALQDFEDRVNATIAEIA